MKRPLPNFARTATIVVSFIEAAQGSLVSAVVFWVALFSAAVMTERGEKPRADENERLM
jgi:hypothetical protein